MGYASDDANTFTFDAVAGGPFDGLGTFTFDDGTKGVYRVEYPDVFAEVAGVSTAAMRYPGGGVAALASFNVIAFGMGLETVVPAGARAQIFGRAVAHLAPGVPAGDLDLDLDGASDACELQYGFDPADAADGAQDADGDGASNAEECQAGTDPRGGLPGLDAGLPDAEAPGLDAAAPGSDAAGLGADAEAEVADASVEPVDAAAEAPDAVAEGPDAAVEGLDAAVEGQDAAGSRTRRLGWRQGRLLGQGRLRRSRRTAGRVRLLGLRSASGRRLAAARRDGGHAPEEALILAGRAARRGRHSQSCPRSLWV
jgi:hypothetical protein